MEELFRYILLLAVAYLFGSFPSAYLLIKLKTKKDIRTLGSGNVGALNALRSGKSKTIALIVLVLDLLKGALPAWYLAHVQQADFLIQVTVVSGVLLGHVYPVWLRFKGGRGLAVVAGALLVIQPVLVGIWLGFWLIFYLLIYKHIVASLIATFILPLVVYFVGQPYFADNTLLMILPVCMLIFQRHLERLPDLVEEKRTAINNGEA